LLVRVSQRANSAVALATAESPDRVRLPQKLFRSQNDSGDPDNLITLCHGHHRRGIHEGHE